MSELNKWEQSIVDRLRYGLYHNQSVTLGADEVHIPMNAIIERGMHRTQPTCDISEHAETCEDCGFCTKPYQFRRAGKLMPNHEPLTLIDALRQTDEYIPLIFTHGSCWKFHIFILGLFPEAVPYKVISEPTIRINRYDHIITKIGDRYFDITGEVQPSDFCACEMVQADDVRTFECWSFAGNHLLAMTCPHCGEDIAVGAAGKADNTPLTLEELRQMGDTPVWLVGVSQVDQWAQIQFVDSLTVGFKLFGDGGSWAVRTAKYGKTWLAYRRKPEPEGGEG